MTNTPPPEPYRAPPMTPPAIEQSVSPEDREHWDRVIERSFETYSEVQGAAFDAIEHKNQENERVQKVLNENKAEADRQFAAQDAERAKRKQDKGKQGKKEQAKTKQPKKKQGKKKTKSKGRSRSRD